MIEIANLPSMCRGLRDSRNENVKHTLPRGVVSVSNSNKKKIAVVRKFNGAAIPPDEWREIQRLLAVLVAEAYAREHPECFGGATGPQNTLTTHTKKNAINNRVEAQGDNAA